MISRVLSNGRYRELKLLRLFVSVLYALHCIACIWAHIGLNWTRTVGYSLEVETSWILAFGYTDPRALPRRNVPRVHANVC